jgi:hypothetical protein
MILDCMIWLEMLSNVQDVYRPIIDNEANDFNYYFRGNQYTKK